MLARTRRLAAASLAFMGLTDGVDLLFPALAGSSDISFIALDALEALNEKALPFLMSGLENSEWRRHIKNCLIRMTHPDVVPTVMLGLQSAQPHVRSAAAYILSLKASPCTTEVLIAALEDEDIHVQTHAAWALWAIDTPKAMAAMEHWRSKLSPDDQSRFNRGYALADEYD